MNRLITTTLFSLALGAAMFGTTHARQNAAPPGGAPTTRPDDNGPPPRPRDDRGPQGRPGDGGPRDGRPGEDRPPRGGPENGPGGPRSGPGGPGGPNGEPDGGLGGPNGGPGGGPSGHGGGPADRRPPSVDTMRNYLELVDRYAAVSGDPTKAGVAAVLTAADLLRAQGPASAITYFEGVLDDQEHHVTPQVNRAIRLQLAELYKAAGQADKAGAQLKMVMQDRQ